MPLLRGRIFTIDERLERLRLRLDVHADLLVLLGGDLDERLADLVARVGDDRKLNRIAATSSTPAAIACVQR